MKIIITYASCGAGHLRAAQALYHYFKENSSGQDIEIVDILEKTQPFFKNSYRYGYPFLVNHALWLWGFAFWITRVKYLKAITRGITSLINRLNNTDFADFLIRSQPDFVISTHFLPSEITAYLKKIKRLKSRLVTVITDFGVHPFWIADDTDMYIAASVFTKEQLIRQGVGEGKIKVLGIPIEASFLKQYDKGALFKRFDLEPDKFTVLIVTGSFGIGEIEKAVELLYQEAQILVVCARNQVLYASLKKKGYPGLKVFGFIDNIQELMAVSDIIIAKPGGLTIAESLAMDLVPIFITSIPGQETENAAFLTRKSIGINIKEITSIKDVVLDFKNHPDKLKNIRERIRQEKKPFAARDLYDVICQGGVGISG